MIESSLLELKTSVDLNFGIHLENINTLNKQDMKQYKKMRSKIFGVNGRIT